MTTTINTTNTILRSFSLSPSPLSKEEEEEEESNNDSRRQDEEEEKKENVDEQPYCTTTSRRVTTAATHLHCTTNTTTVTFNDGINNVSQKKESNSSNNSNTSMIDLSPSIFFACVFQTICLFYFLFWYADLLNRPSSSTSVHKSMPLNSLLVKTSSLNTIIQSPTNPQQSSTAATTARKLISNGLLSLIGRSNSNNSKASTSTEENKQLRRTSSTQLRAQRKTKQQTTLTTGTNGNKRLSADVESFFPRTQSSSINNNHLKISNQDPQIFDKATTNSNIEPSTSISLVSTQSDKNINATCSTNTG